MTDARNYSIDIHAVNSKCLSKGHNCANFGQNIAFNTVKSTGNWIKVLEKKILK